MPIVVGYRASLVRALVPLQLLSAVKHAACFNSLPGRKFHLKAPSHQCPKPALPLLTKTSTVTARGSTHMAAAAPDAGGKQEAKRAIFLKNDGQWIDYEATFARDTSSDRPKEDDLKYLKALSLAHLKQEARERGQKSTGYSKEELMGRLLSSEAPPPTRPRRRTHKTAAAKPDGHVERQATARPRALHPYTPQLRVVSWNVNGIRALLDKEEGRKALKALVAQERPHVLGLQEIRIAAVGATGKGFKTPHPSFADVVETILPDYDTVWLSSFPPARAGYSGTALFLRKKRHWDIGCPTLLRVRGGIGHPEGDLEGRVTTAEYDVAFVVNVYTPNAGAGLKRLHFRTSEWDEAFAAYVRRLEETKPVLVVGDLNVAHEDRDFYNPEQKRMRKAAGTTPEERSSFAHKLLGRPPPPSCIPGNANSATSSAKAADARSSADTSSASLGDSDVGTDGLTLADTFRERYPNATGVFSYWSVRAGNRPLNRGMRLDYCLASRTLVDGKRGSVHDAFVLDQDTVGVSDHCPVGVVLRLGDRHPE